MGFPKDEDFHPRLGEFRKELQRLHYKKHTVGSYITECRKFLKTGRPLTPEQIDDYYEEEKRLNHSQPTSRKSCLLSFMKFLNGEEIKRPRVDYYYGYTGCDEDCFNCKYPDCLKPQQKCNSIPEIKHNAKSTKELDLTLGRVNG